MLLRNNQSVKDRIKKTFKNESTLIEAAAMQEITGPNAFKELELESHKYKIS